MTQSRFLHPLTRPEGLRGQPRIPGDKSVSHRALMLGTLAEGVTEVTGLLDSADVRSTEACLRALGARIAREDGRVLVTGIGRAGLRPPAEPLDCGNSGTTMRLLMGIIAGAELSCELTGDASLCRRPMKRVAAPLAEMGARIELGPSGTAPLRITGTRHPHAVECSLPIASAQLKSALLLAGLGARGITRLTGLIASRDHTERMLGHFGVDLGVTEREITLRGGQPLRAAPVLVPSDISTAAFWLGAAAMIPGSRIELDGVSLNPTRTGILAVLARMGARVETRVTSHSPEPVGRIAVEGAPLRATQIDAAEVPSLIDEIPLIAVLATAAEGVTEIRGAEELRVKESDRIEAVARGLRAMGAEIETRPDGFAIRGPQRLGAAAIDSYADHRIAMAFSIAALRADAPVEIRGADCVAVSYPEFYSHLEALRG